MSYHDYLNTDYWKKVAEAVKERAGYRCQMCNSPLDLNAHHRTYEHRGNELEHLDDLTCVCYRCHQLFHGKNQPSIEVSSHAKTSTSAAPASKVEDYVEVVRSNYKDLDGKKPCYHWAVSVGIDPTAKGWRKRAIGHFVPGSWFV